MRLSGGEGAGAGGGLSCSGARAGVEGCDAAAPPARRLSALVRRRSHSSSVQRPEDRLQGSSIREPLLEYRSGSIDRRSYSGARPGWAGIPIRRFPSRRFRGPGQGGSDDAGGERVVERRVLASRAPRRPASYVIRPPSTFTPRASSGSRASRRPRRVRELLDVRQRDVRQRSRRGDRHRAGHVRDAVVDDAVDRVDGSSWVVGRDVSAHPPWSIATSTSTELSFIVAEASRA